MISWVLFDVGNVIMYDVPAMALMYEVLFKEIQKVHPHVTFQTILAERERLILDKTDGGHHWTIGRRYLGKEAWLNLRARVFEEIDRDYDKYNLLIPNIHQVVEETARFYKLGIAANQVKACRQAFERHGLLKYFSMVFLSEERGLNKPDIRFFTSILQEIDTPPEQCVMIGDRVDFDIRPAKSLGMKTIRVKLDMNSDHYHPETELQRLYFESQQRAALSYVDPKSASETPDITVTNIEQIPEAIKKII